MSETSKGAKAARYIKTLCYEWGTRFVGYVKRTREERKTKKQQEPSADRAARRTMWATVWIATFTSILAIVGYLQWSELNESGTQTDRLIRLYRQQVNQLSKQAGDTTKLATSAGKQADQALAQANATTALAQTSRDSLVAVQRAFIFPDTALSVIAVRNDRTASTFTFPVAFENSGSTPTKNLHMHINWTLQANGAPEPPFSDIPVNGSVPHNTEAVIGPHSNGSARLEAVIPQETVKMAFKIPIRIRIWGWVRYQDVFKGTPWHLDEYCYFVRFSGKPEADLPEGANYDNCPTHNCSDGQCKDYDPRGQPN